MLIDGNVNRSQKFLRRAILKTSFETAVKVLAKNIFEEKN